MLLIHTALSREAKPVAARLGLRPEPLAASIRLYAGDDLFLVVSGTGSRRAAAAVGFALGLLHARHGRYPAALNLGLCGAVGQGRESGGAFLINHCQAAADGRRFVPDVLFRHRLREAGLHTFDHVVESEDSLPRQFPRIDLVDMEAAGFWEAASAFVPPSRVQSVKIVGDHLRDAPTVTPEDVEDRMRAALPAVLDFIEDFRRHLNTRNESADPAGEAVLAAWAEALRLTETQRHRLRDAVRFAALNGGGSAPERLGPPPAHPPSHKHERNRQFERLLEILHESAHPSV